MIQSGGAVKSAAVTAGTGVMAPGRRAVLSHLTMAAEARSLAAEVGFVRFVDRAQRQHR